MILSISTHWNAHRHGTGEAMVDEILAAGFSHIELGYDLRMDLVPGVQERLKQNAVTIDSVHNYCPVPMGFPHGHPELFLLTSPDERERQGAVRHITETIEFAAQMGARIVVLHAGRLRMSLSRKLIALCEEGRRHEPRYEKIKDKLLIKREKKVTKPLAHLYEGIEALLPVLERTGIALAIENLPSWETIPTETELLALLAHFDSPRLAYWHDIGHGKVREQLGFISCLRWLEKLQPWLAGMHVHDVQPPAADHLMPPKGSVDFAPYQPFAESSGLAVFEPAPGTPIEEVVTGLQTIKDAWRPRPENGG